MSVTVVQRLVAFFGFVWSFILTLVRSLLALFSFRRRASDPFSLPNIDRTPNEALARAHSHLRPILLTPRSIIVSPAHAQSTRTGLATSTFLGKSESGTASTSVPEISSLQRISPKLDPHDAELGLSVTVSGFLAASATSLREGTPDTSPTESLYVLPLTPPDRCYLAPLPSVTDCPYAEPWPTNVSLDRGKPRLPGSPLKLSINTEPAFPVPMVAPIGSPPPARWSPLQIWTSTPCKNDSPAISDPVLSSFDHQIDASSALATISHAIISRSQASIRPYDDASNSSASSDASPFVDHSNGLAETRHNLNRRTQQSRNQPYPRFHHPDAYACTWRRHGTRLPGKLDRTSAYSHSCSHTDLQVSEWYDADAFALSPVAALSPPLSECATEDEDEMPLSRLRERLARRSAAAGASIGLGVHVGAGTCKAVLMSPRTRRMSEGCLLAISESTPTRVGVSTRSGRHVVSMALDGNEYSSKDWLEALSLRFCSEQKGALAAKPQSCMAVPSPTDVTAS